MSNSIKKYVCMTSFVEMAFTSISTEIEKEVHIDSFCHSCIRYSALQIKLIEIIVYKIPM